MELHTVRIGEEIITYNTAMAWALNNSQYMMYYKTVTSIDHVHEEKNMLNIWQAIKKNQLKHMLYSYNALNGMLSKSRIPYCFLKHQKPQVQHV